MVEEKHSKAYRGLAGVSVILAIILVAVSSLGYLNIFGEQGRKIVRYGIVIELFMLIFVSIATVWILFKKKLSEISSTSDTGVDLITFHLGTVCAIILFNQETIEEATV
jgi:hypothetical protein